MLDEHHNVIATTTTDAHGRYKFKGLEKGAYTIHVVEPECYDFTHQDVGCNWRKDSDVDPHTGKSHVIHLDAGEHVRHVDAGLVKEPTGSIEGRLFIDEGHKGIDDHDVGKSGVTVNLLDEHHNVVATTHTDAHGAYQFEDLKKGGYFVEVVAPEGFTFTHENVGHDDAIDSDVDAHTGKTHAIHLDAGEHVSNVDAGLLADDGPTDPDDDAIRIEAEDFTLVTNFVQNGDAIQAPDQGPVRADLNAADAGIAPGFYDISIDLVDETDGVSEISLLVDDVEIATFTLDGGVTNSVNNSLNDRTFTAENVEIGAGDMVTVSLDGERDGFELLRIDAVEFDPIA